MKLCQVSHGYSQFGFAFGPFPDGSLVRSLTIVAYEDIEAELLQDASGLAVEVAAAFCQHPGQNTAGDRLIDILNSRHRVIEGGPLFATADNPSTPPTARVPIGVFSSAAATDAAVRAITAAATVIPVNKVVAAGHQWLIVAGTSLVSLGTPTVTVAVDAVPPARRNNDLGWPLA
jgi:hypothetical protein